MIPTCSSSEQPGLRPIVADPSRQTTAAGSSNASNRENLHETVEGRRLRYINKSGGFDGWLMIKDIGNGISTGIDSFLSKIEKALPELNDGQTTHPGCPSSQSEQRESGLSERLKKTNEHYFQHKKPESQLSTILAKKSTRKKAASKSSTKAIAESSSSTDEVASSSNTENFQIIRENLQRKTLEIWNTIIEIIRVGEPKIEETRQIKSFEDFKDIWSNGVTDLDICSKTLKRINLRALKILGIGLVGLLSLIYFRGPLVFTPSQGLGLTFTTIFDPTAEELLKEKIMHKATEMFVAVGVFFMAQMSTMGLTEEFYTPKEHKKHGYRWVLESQEHISGNQRITTTSWVYKNVRTNGFWWLFKNHES